VPPLKSISLMATDPPTLSPLPPPNERFPIAGRVLTFDEMEGVHDQQISGYSRTRRMACSTGLAECVPGIKCAFDKKLYSFGTCF
jgi:hypothetical protein